MLKKDKVKIINGVEHIGNIPKQQGSLLWSVEKCPFWLTFFMLFIFIAIEIFIFACLYKIISSSSFTDCLDYSILSILGNTVTSSVQNSLWINRILSFEFIITNCIISFFMTIVLYKLVNIKPQLIKMEDHLVFDPTSGTLRLRITNRSKFDLTNVHIDAYFRIHIPKSGRHANARLLLKIDTMNLLRPYTVWNIATKPFKPEDKDKTKLDIERFDSDRVYEFIPDLLNEKYRSDDMKKAKEVDYNNLNVTITIKSPLFGADWVYNRSYKTINFVCGKLISVDPHISGKETTDWTKWGKYQDLSKSHCEECIFADHCGIIKKEDTIIN